jgi:hypothetical protein
MRFSVQTMGKREANIRGAGKFVHVVFKYLSSESAAKRGGAGGVTPSHNYLNHYFQ